MPTLKRVWKNYNLSITLFMLFTLSWTGHFYFQWQEFVATQKEHNQSADATQYFPEFAARTFENWQSEFLQLFAMVVLTSFMSHKGSPESKDSEEKTERKLAAIEGMLKDLTKKHSPRNS
jgi:hypothetical protein